MQLTFLLQLFCFLDVRHYTLNKDRVYSFICKILIKWYIIVDQIMCMHSKPIEINRYLRIFQFQSIHISCGLMNPQ